MVVKFVANYQAAEVLQPGEKTFDLPAATITAQPPAILGWSLSVASMRRDHHDSQPR